MTERKEKISNYRPQRRNANKHNQRGMGLLQKSIEGDGFIGAMTSAADGEIIAGSARLEKSAEVFGVDADVIIVETDGKKPIIVKRTDIPNADDERAKRLAIADNRVQEIDLEWDTEVLQGLAEFDGIDLGDWWSEKELKDIGIEFEKPEAPEPQTDRAEELREKWGVELGQLWQLGAHRLICGDCTDGAVVDRVMMGEKAGAVVTDPPYGINREGIENDDPEGLRKLFDGCLAVMPIEDAVVIAFQSPRLFPIWLDALREKEQDFQRALWFYDETDVTFPWRGWIMTSQIAIVSSIGKPEWSKDVYHHDCYIVKTAGKQGFLRGGHEGNGKAIAEHPTMKPLDVVEDLVKHTTGTVYEPFLGSGTTLIACERLSRKCRAVEISPAYCAVTLERWHEMTGEMPVLLTD